MFCWQMSHATSETDSFQYFLYLHLVSRPPSSKWPHSNAERRIDHLMPCQKWIIVNIHQFIHAGGCYSFGVLLHSSLLSFLPPSFCLTRYWRKITAGDYKLGGRVLEESRYATDQQEGSQSVDCLFGTRPSGYPSCLHRYRRHGDNSTRDQGTNTDGQASFRGYSADKFHFNPGTTRGHLNTLAASRKQYQHTIAVCDLTANINLGGGGYIFKREAISLDGIWAQ